MGTLIINFENIGQFGTSPMAYRREGRESIVASDKVLENQMGLYHLFHGLSLEFYKPYSIRMCCQETVTYLQRLFPRQKIRSRSRRR